MLAVILLASGVAAGTAFRVVPGHAEAGFDLKATMHTVHGKTAAVTGEIRADGAPGGPRELSGRIEIDAASLDTANSGRDKKLHETTLAVDRFPRIVLTPERFEPAGPAGPDGAQAGVLTGALTIRDVTKPVRVTASLRETPDRISIEGTFEVPWPDFGVPDPSFLFVKVEKVAHAHFRAELSRVKE